MNCVNSFYIHANQTPNRPAIAYLSKKINLKSNLNNFISFHDLKVKSLKANALLESKNIKRGDAILLFETPNINLYALIIACLSQGIKILLVEPWLPVKNINAIIKKIAPKALVSSGIAKFLSYRSEEIRSIKFKFASSRLNSMSKTTSTSEVEKMNESDIAFLTFTSGTTGVSKGVIRTHGLLIKQMDILAKYLSLANEKPSEGLVDLTVFTNLVLANLAMGKTSLLVPSNWNKNALKLIDQLPPELAPSTVASGPAFMAELMKFSQAKSLKKIFIGGALADNNFYQSALDHWGSTAEMDHVYGSTEVEPVAHNHLLSSVNQSLEKGYFQTLSLGPAVPEINTMTKDNSLWVSGVHVSPEYFESPEENRLNKYVDSNHVLWHNMGDRIDKDEKNNLWYQGRSNLPKDDFLKEQMIYGLLGHSNCFIYQDILVGEVRSNAKLPVKKIIRCKIYRDNRHRARIDRVKTLKKAKIL